MIRLIFSLIILAALLVLALANKEPVQLYYLFGTTSPLPLYLILVGTFIVGGLVFTVILLPAWIRDKMEIRKLRRSLQKIGTEKGGTEEKDDSDIVSLEEMRHRSK